MEINKLNISIKDYIGILEGGVAALISIKYIDKIYEAIYWYDNRDNKVLTIDVDLHDEIGEIEKYDGYDDIMEYLNNESPTFEDIFDKLSVI